MHVSVAQNGYYNLKLLIQCIASFDSADVCYC